MRTCCITSEETEAIFQTEKNGRKFVRLPVRLPLAVELGQNRCGKTTSIKLTYDCDLTITDKTIIALGVTVYANKDVIFGFSFPTAAFYCSINIIVAWLKNQNKNYEEDSMNFRLVEAVVEKARQLFLPPQ